MRRVASGMRHVAVGLVVSLLSVCVTLGALEVGMRLFAPQPTKVSVPAIIDPDLIYRLPAHARGTDVKEEFAVKIETNSQGLRDREYPAEKSAGVVSRILVLGDSMTFAEGAEAEETYPKVLERALADRYGAGRYEVINAGIRGYGTDQELVLFERLVPIYHPDIVLLAFFAGNDFDDNVYGSLFAVEGDRLVRLPLSDESSPKYRYYRHQSFIQTFPGYRILIEHSHLMNFVRRWWAAKEFSRLFATAEKPDPVWEERAWRLTRSILVAWVERARGRGIRPLIVMIPSWNQIYVGRDEKVDPRTERVIALARARGVPVIDSRQALRAGTQARGPVFHPRDRHLTPYGHRLVAAFLQECLSVMRIVPRPERAESRGRGRDMSAGIGGVGGGPTCGE